MGVDPDQRSPVIWAAGEVWEAHGVWVLRPGLFGDAPPELGSVLFEPGRS